MLPTIWLGAATLYTLFWFWYVGPRKKITPEEAERFRLLFDDKEHDHTQEQIRNLCEFFANDDGKDFVMVNLIQLKDPVTESRKKLAQYQKVFLGSLLRKAGHPVFIAIRTGANVEQLNCDHHNDWKALGMIRYRSRRDLMEILPDTIGSSHHALKLEALEKTIAYPASDWFIFGGPRLTVALLIALVACVVQLAVL